MTTKTKPEWKQMSGPMGGGNSILNCDGFFISYNPDTGNSILGSFFAGDGDGEETALCIPKDTKDGGTRYLILNGDWRKNYEKLAPKGIAACRKFYESKKAKYDSSYTTSDD